MNRHLLALNTELPAAVDGEAPEWIELIPSGPQVSGRDGRTWRFDDPAAQAVLGDFDQRGTQLPIDWEHATQHRAPRGKDAPAAAWVDRLEMRDGALWGHVEWTPRGQQQVLNREYRFLSPVFDYDPDSLRIHRLVSAGLSNKPNLSLTALNQEGDVVALASQETDPVKISPELAAALGLSDGADDAAAVAAVNALKSRTATNSEQPSLERFVPRADYEQMSTRATNAEQALAVERQEQLTTAINTEIEAAVEAGKIAPASADFYRATCTEEGGLERFREFVKSAPVIAPESGLDGRKPASSATALNAEEQQVAELLGISHDDFIKSRDGAAQ